ncbi:uncharacterized protein PHACADRAFT_196429 [Phanerochaete carnosa HHB-10118-sp]|uniref:Fungal-type protein kinase domain-containing protein n=1 Tax=Phanerochaete carnosa (strain HHB-10118-sp) TaxID=650164 RepID=K5UVE9_PHACS|nr:uncharacterized protein PHACADRAFT_196429 [Phanerochaete carnosa HHB-10118-sp]EKM53991.1 hypothetical protein PHACADRAFT_196429 [Phanerochaete carnosa HHB-10118-sp]
MAGLPPRTPKRSLPIPTMPDIGPSPIQKKGCTSAPTDLATEGQKHLMLDDLQETVPQVDWAFFEDNILPPLPTSVNLDDIVTNLVEKQAVAHMHGQMVWAKFELGSPKLYQGGEDAIFRRMVSVVAAVKDATGDTKKARRLFRCNPNATPTSETRDNNTRPDGYYVRNDVAAKDRIPRWSNIIVPAEFKIHDRHEDVNRNWAQILWSLNHLMREDPTRRFAIGFTIENTNMRLWFASRSDVLVSLPVNFITGIRRVSEFFLRIFYAEDYQLGFDESMKRLDTLDASGRVQYDIRVNETMYRTQRLVSSIGVETIRGRGTRVWEVKELDGHGKEKPGSVIVKDSWGDKKRRREEDINKDIRDTETIDEQHSQVLNGCLLTCLNSWDVTVDTSTGRKIDSTREVMFCGNDPTYLDTVKVKKDLDASKRVAPKLPAQGTLSQLSTIEPSRFVYGEKIYHRVVFAEVGTTIIEAQTLSQVFKFLSNIAIALYGLHSAGWVHRDISAGNIIIHEKDAKLGDVEYAKQEADDTRHDVRTGTVFFMAAEVDSGEYLLLAQPNRTGLVPIPEGNIIEPKRRKTFRLPTFSDEQKPGPSHGPVCEPADMPQQPKIIFKHNPLHDLESLFWLAVYLVLCTVLERPPDTLEGDWQKYTDAHDKLAAELFHDIVARITVVTTDWGFAPRLNGLHPRVRAICQELEVVRSALTQAYKLAERDPSYLTFEAIMSIELALPSDPETSMPLHHLFASQFWSISGQLGGEHDIKFEKRLSLSGQRQLMEALLAKETATKVSGSRAGQDVESEESSRPRKKTKVLNPAAREASERYRQRLRKPGPVSANAVGL